MKKTLNVSLMEPFPSVHPYSETQMTDYFTGSELFWLLLHVIVFASNAYSGQTRRTIKGSGSKWKLMCSGCVYLILCTRIAIRSYAYLTGRVVGIINCFEPIYQTIFIILADNLITSGSHGKGIHSIVWLSVVTKHAMTIYSDSKGIAGEGIEDQIDFVASSILLVVLSVRAIISSLPYKERSSKTDKPTPEENASLISKLTFSWMSGLMRQGYSKTLKNHDLYQLARERTADDAFSYFKPYWDREYNKVKRKADDLSDQTDKSKNNTQPARKEASVLRAVLFAFYPLIAYTIILELIIKSLEFTYPMILKRMIQMVEDESAALWKGASYALLMFCLNMTTTVIGNHVGHHNIHFEYRLKGALMSCIYKKMLRMSHAARKSSTVGEIVNLMSVDSGRFVTMVHWINNIWLCPLQVIVAMCLLWTEMGASAIAGFLTIAVFLPVHTLLAKKTKVLHLELSDTKDSRIKLMNEILNGIKVMKLYTWEESFEMKVQVIREKEISLMRKIKIWDSVSTLIWHIGPFLVSLSTFALYILGDDSHMLTAEKAFVSISIFHTLSWAMSAIPHTVNGINMGFVSLKRINTFLNSEELDHDVITRNHDNVSVVSVSEATFSWDRKEASFLKDIALDIPEGSLVAIVGPVGSGKSSLLSAFLGEMTLNSGTVNIKGSTAYVAQQAWIQNGTLRDNVLFGRPYDEEFYDKVVDSCALLPDLDILPGGNMAEIGEKGVNLSVGQKQRVNLARAVYQDSDIYLLDDPLSAVDAHVGKHIFDKVIGPNGILKNKTRILVTHGVHFLPKVDKIITLSNGSISDMGSYEELKSNSGSFSQFLKTYVKNDDSNCSDSNEEDISYTKDNKFKKSEKGDKKQKGTNVKEENESGTKIVGEEDVETGEVKFAHLMSYILSVGMTLCVFIVLSYVVYQSTDVYSTYWLSEWTTDVGKMVTMHAYSNTSHHDDQRYYRLGGYGLCGFFRATLALVQALLVFLGGLVASRTLHQKLLRNVLSSPMSFFETNPVGRIVTRFSKDIETIDWLSHELKGYTECLSKMIMIPFVIGYNIPWFLVVLVPVFFIFKSVQKFHNPTTRQLKRLESANKSPMYTHFSESINGVSTIRAYQEQERFASESRQRIDAYHKSLFCLINVHRWVGIRVELIAISLDLIAALLAILSRDVLSTGIVALCITYTMDATGTLNWFMHCSLNTEEKLISVERINEYMEKPTEAAWTIEEKKPKETWPDSGKVTFNNYQTRYRDDLDLVLKGISCAISPGEKIGIVGRTGAGKSSLTMALFRIIESAGGNIVIDDVDISTIGLHDLRSKLTIIPQDPVIFSGTLRMNLDPFEHYSDIELWKALEHSHLSNFVAALPNKLQHQCSEGGDNLSVGQRQLLCLARALLKKTKILILDEATAAVDLETDELIQKTIRTEFADCTILTIAHRLNTIMDYTRVMVLSSGKIREFDTPAKLLSNTKSVFYGMAKDANLI